MRFEKKVAHGQLPKTYRDKPPLSNNTFNNVTPPKLVRFKVVAEHCRESTNLRNHCRESTNSQIDTIIAHSRVVWVVPKNYRTGTTVAHLQYTKIKPI
jgi:hypothetical protein